MKGNGFISLGKRSYGKVMGPSADRTWEQLRQTTTLPARAADLEPRTSIAPAVDGRGETSPTRSIGGGPLCDRWILHSIQESSPDSCTTLPSYSPRSGWSVARCCIVSSERADVSLRTRDVWITPNDHPQAKSEWCTGDSLSSRWRQLRTGVPKVKGGRTPLSAATRHKGYGAY